MQPCKRRKIESQGKPDTVLHRRTLRFAVSIAAKRALPDLQLVGGHAVGEAYWYRFVGQEEVKEDQVQAISKELDSMIKADLAISQTTKNWEEAHEYFKKNQQKQACKLLETRATTEVHVNECGGDYRLALYALASTLGNLGISGHSHEIRKYQNGFIAIYGNDWKDESGIAASFADHLRWGEEATKVASVGDLNALSVEKGEQGRIDFGMQAEFRQEQKLTEIARMIHERNSKEAVKDHVRVLAIAGPTSSGKTTFAHKLAIYLKNFGYEAKALSVDHYYLNVEDQPRYKIRNNRNDVDYDSLESMDIALVSDHINRLITGETVCTPEYDFKSGNRIPPGHLFELPPRGILIIEGIHALNPEYTAGIDSSKVFRVYISPLSALQIDDFNVIKTTSHRLLRRMTRDYRFRGYSAEHTLGKWEHVRRGEHAYIFKNQNNSDFVMNSAMEHEIAVLKGEVLPLLKCVLPTSPVFGFAQDTMAMLDTISGWPERCVGHTSIFREFLGNGAYDKH